MDAHESYAALNKLMSHLQKSGPTTILVQQMTDDEFMVHTEWEPEVGSLSNGNATGWGKTHTAALVDMLQAVEKGEFPLLPVTGSGVRLLDPFEDDNVRAGVEADAADEREDLRRSAARGDE